ncbi:MAG TPA: serine hydrolase [Pyrinomonadaceae bacterium]|nr:serine hydrolase [Pyrinomonadaceae bacterium]
MKQIKFSLVSLLLISLTILNQAGAAQQNNPGNLARLNTSENRSQLASRLERLIPQLMEQGFVPGLSIALVRNGEIFWHGGFGVRNAQTREPVTDNTVFEAASLSKPVFAYAVMKLVDSGKLNLDTPLVKYLPGAYVNGDERANQITARNVLTHTTGFPNWRPRGGALTIKFNPGERFSYSGEGFVYLQKVVEHMTGQPLDALMQSTVFVPLGMASSSYVWQGSFENRAATGHDPVGNAGQLRKPTEANAAASLHTTALDYAKFVIAMMNGTGLKPQTYKQMLTPQIKVDERCHDCLDREPTGHLSQTISWGLGIGLQNTGDGESFWHWGDNDNEFQCYVVAFPKQKTGLVVFTNSGSGHAIIPEIIAQSIGGQHPAIAWIDYEQYNSPTRKLFRGILANGVTAINEYREFRKNHTGAEILTENQMNRLGYGLLSARKVREAIEIFKLNVEDHPDSSNVYDSLGEAYMRAGERELAIQSYKKSIELNPNNTNGIEMLRKLQQQ